MLQLNLYQRHHLRRMEADLGKRIYASSRSQYAGRHDRDAGREICVCNRGCLVRLEQERIDVEDYCNVNEARRHSGCS